MFDKGQVGFVWLLSALVLTFGQQEEEVQDILSSLKCYTDYISKIDCQWIENTVAKHYIPMDLHFRKYSATNNRSGVCHRMEPRQRTTSPESHCTIKEAAFAVAINYSFFFKPKKPTNLKKSFRLLENIKLQPPFNLTVTATETGDYRLSWKTSYTGNSSKTLLGTLQYEVNYKQTWESWENSVSETITGGKRELEIHSSALSSPGTYVARVRARPQHYNYRSLWSGWSSAIQWKVMGSDLDSQAAEAEVMPQNLQCFYDGIQEIECTWEVPRESSKYFTFDLHYGKANSSERQVCKPSVILHWSPHVTVHRCNIPVSDPQDLENYEVLLQLVKPSMIFKPHQNIKANAPYNLTLKQLNDGRFQLQWNASNSMRSTTRLIYKLQYEINYKKADESWEDSKVKMIPQDTTTFILPKNSLEPSSQYCVRVRSKVICSPNDPHCYQGPWSDWSQTVQLDTGPDKEIPIIVACTLLLLFFIFTPTTFILIKRKKRLWLESIPDPAKSRLFHTDRQNDPRPLSTIKTVTLEEGNICNVVAAELSESSPPQITPRVKAKCPLKEDKWDNSSPPVMTNGTTQAKIYQSFKPEAGAFSLSEAECPSPLKPPSEPTNFNGPYLFNFQDVSSVLSVLSDLKTATSKNASYFIQRQEAPGYVKLPQIPCGEVQAVGQCNPELAPSLPLATYVLTPPVMSRATNYYLHTDENARAHSSQTPFQQLLGSTSNYVASSPPTVSAPTSSPELMTDYVHTKGTEVSSLTQPVPRTASPFLTSTSHGVDPQLVSKDEDRNVQGTGNTSQVPPAWTQWPATCSGYVLSPPDEEVVQTNIAPTFPKSTKHEDQSLSQQGVRPQPLTQTMDIDPAPEVLPLSKYQVDPQKPTTEESEPPPANTVNNEATDIILYQQGAKPILFQQIGDYCFLPGSCPTKPTESIKNNLSPSLTNPELANKSLGPQGKMLPHQLPPALIPQTT